MDHKPKPTAKEIAEAWKNFKPAVPLSFTLARIQAIKAKYGIR